MLIHIARLSNKRKLAAASMIAVASVLALLYRIAWHGHDAHVSDRHTASHSAALAGNTIGTENGSPDSSLLTGDAVLINTGISTGHLTSDAHGHEHARNTADTETSEADANSDNMPELTRLLSLVKQVSELENPYNSGDFAQQFAMLLHQSPELIGDAMLEFGQLPAGMEKEVMLGLLVDASMMLGNDEIERQAVAFIASGAYDHDASLYRLSAELGVRSSQSRQALLEKLPSLSSPQQVYSVIESFVPQIVSAEERAAVVSEITPYLNASDPRVRGAAIKAVGTWGGPQQAHVISAGLMDGSGDIRHAAAVTALRSGIRNDQIKRSLMSMMNSPNEEMDIRLQSYYALSNYSLAGQDYDDYYRFNLELEKQTGHEH